RRVSRAAVAASLRSLPRPPRLDLVRVFTIVLVRVVRHELDQRMPARDRNAVRLREVLVAQPLDELPHLRVRPSRLRDDVIERAIAVRLEVTLVRLIDLLLRPTILRPVGLLAAR